MASTKVKQKNNARPFQADIAIGRRGKRFVVLYSVNGEQHEETVTTPEAVSIIVRRVLTYTRTAPQG